MAVLEVDGSCLRAARLAVLDVDGSCLKAARLAVLGGGFENFGKSDLRRLKLRNLEQCMRFGLYVLIRRGIF